MRGQAPDDPVDLGLEAHVEHPVGLVEDEDPDVLERDQALLDEVVEPAGGGDDDVRAAQALHLRLDRGAAVGGCRTDALRLAEQYELLGHLERELAGGGEHERGRGRLVGRDELDDRQREGERLPGARRRLAEDVAALERDRDDEGLDTKRLGNAAGGERLLDLRAHAERAKRLGHTGFDSFDSDSRCRPETAKGGTGKLNLTGLPDAVPTIRLAAEAPASRGDHCYGRQ